MSPEPAGFWNEPFRSRKGFAPRQIISRETRDACAIRGFAAACLKSHQHSGRIALSNVPNCESWAGAERVAVVITHGGILVK